MALILFPIYAHTYPEPVHPEDDLARSGFFLVFKLVRNLCYHKVLGVSVKQLQFDPNHTSYCFFADTTGHCMVQHDLIRLDGDRLSGIVDWECVPFKPECSEFMKAEIHVRRDASCAWASIQQEAEQALWKVDPLPTFWISTCMCGFPVGFFQDFGMQGVVGIASGIFGYFIFFYECLHWG